MRLLQAAADGDHRAREALVTAHLDWVTSAASERTDRGLSEADLFQEGTIGLIEAIGRYGSGGHDEFDAFAKSLIADHMDRALAHEEKVRRAGQQLVQAAHDYVEADMKVQRRLGRAATDAELAEKLEWSLERTREIGRIVADARRRHDEELLQFLDPGDIDLDMPLEDRNGGDGE